MNIHVNLVVIFGLILFGLGSALTLFAGDVIYLEITDYYSYRGGEPYFDWNRIDRVDSGVWMFLVLGILFFIFGIGLLLKAKWTKKTVTPLIIISMLGWTYFVMEIFPSAMRSNDFFIFIGMSTIGYATFTCLFLFLKNEKVLAAYDIDFEEYKNDDILDA